MSKVRTFLLCLIIFVMPSIVRACACGCGIFGVGSTFMLPEEDTTCMVYFEYNFMDQNQNWSGTMAAPAANNTDKDIRTSFYNIGVQYMFNQDWGMMANIPYWDRSLTTTIDPAGDVGTFDHGSLGDIKLMGFYTGFSSDKSSGIIFGIKLPTGDHTYENFDPDTEIGTGSTDVILGAYHVGKFAGNEKWRWFVEGTWECPFATTMGYRPGEEIDAATGVYYNSGDRQNQEYFPVLQFLDSDRGGGRRHQCRSSKYRLFGYPFAGPGDRFRPHQVVRRHRVSRPSVLQRQPTHGPVAVKFLVAYAY